MSEPRKVKVMLAEDSQFIHNVIGSMLADTEFEIVGHAREGDKALEVFRAVKPDILLLDVVMPGLAGPQVLEQVIAEDPNARVIMVSSLGTEDVVVDCLRRGAKHFIQKPFEQADLLRVLREQEGAPPRPASQAQATYPFKSVIVGRHFFGEYLLEEGKITRGQLLKAVGLQKSTNQSLEQLCIDRGFLDPGEVEKIHAIQRRNLDREVDQIIVSEGMVPEERLKEVIEEQKKSRLYIGDALVQVGALTQEQLADELKRYHDEESREEREIVQGLDRAKNQFIVKSFIDYTAKIVQRIMGETVKVWTCLPTARNFILHNYTVEQKAKGDMDISFILNIPEAMLLRFASSMYNKDIVAVNETSIDAVKEFLNIVVGNTLSRLSNAGWKFMSEPPELFNNRSDRKYQLGGEFEYVLVSLLTNIGDFDIVVKTPSGR